MKSVNGASHPWLKLEQIRGCSSVLTEESKTIPRLLRRFHFDFEVAAQVDVTHRHEVVIFFRQNDCHPAKDHADEVLSRIALEERAMPSMVCQL